MVGFGGVGAVTAIIAKDARVGVLILEEHSLGKHMSSR